MRKLFGILFLLTGIFAVLGGLYTWGDGNIFEQSELIKVLIPFADILFTGPLSVITGIGILKKKNWAFSLGLVVSGIYLFGSILVFISLFWNRHVDWLLVIPAISGFLIGGVYIFLYFKEKVSNLA